MEIPHILDSKKEPNKELKTHKVVNEITGNLMAAESEFENWDRHARIRGNLYYFWDDDGYYTVAHYYKESAKKWSTANWDYWPFETGAKWAPVSEVQQFTKDNPAPSPFDQ